MDHPRSDRTTGGGHVVCAADIHGTVHVEIRPPDLYVTGAVHDAVDPLAGSQGIVRIANTALSEFDT